MKYLAMHITKVKFWYIYSRTFTKYINGTWSLLNILMIFGIKEKLKIWQKWKIILTHTMYCWLLLHVLLMPAFVVQGYKCELHHMSNHHSSFMWCKLYLKFFFNKIGSLFFLILCSLNKITQLLYTIYKEILSDLCVERWLLSDSLCKQKSHWIITNNGKMNVWKCKMMHTS